MRYKTLRQFYQEKYGDRTFKVPVDAGFSCPNIDGTITRGGCTYCNIHSFTMVEEGDITSQVKLRIDKLKEREIFNYIIYFQSYSNTHAPLDIMRRRIEAALVDDAIRGIYIGTRSDVIEDNKLEYLAQLNTKYDVMVELGLQTANNTTLMQTNRGHSVENFVEGVKRCQEAGLEVCAHAIFGLPGENMDDYKRTAELIAALNVDMVKFHNLEIIKGTAMAKMYKNGEIQLPTEDEYVEAVSYGIAVMPPKTIVSRLQGEAVESMLLATSVTHNKNLLINKIHKYMDEHKLKQGTLHTGIMPEIYGKFTL